LVVSWSDEDYSEEEVESEYAKNVTVLTGVYMSDDESGDEEYAKNDDHWNWCPRRNFRRENQR